MKEDRSRIARIGRAGVVLVAVLASACSSQKEAAPPSQPPALAQALWGDLKPIVSVKELMRDLLDPASDYIFNAVSSVVTKTGVSEAGPKTNEDWDKVRVGAVTLAEGVYLLKIRRPFTPPGDENDSVGPDATELPPAQIMAKVEKDPVEWNARIEALRNVGLEVLDIVKRKDVKELWDAGENLDVACEACHRSYWYPKEDAQFYRNLDQKLRDLPAPTERP